MKQRKQRRVNDAQVERLLQAMRSDVNYRSQLAKRVVQREGIKPGTAEYQRRYKSTMRRFQRYVTEAGQRRSFARAPVQYQQEVRREARRVPLPSFVPPPALALRAPRETSTRLEDYYEDEDEDEGEPTPARAPSPDRERDNYDAHNLKRAVVAYHDGDVDETAEDLGLSKRSTDLLSLATEGEGVRVEGMRGAGEISEAISELLDRVPDADIEDIRDFHDLLMNLPDWQIGMILADMEDAGSTFADWMDAYRNDDMDIEDVSESEYWALWRAAYARASA